MLRVWTFRLRLTIRPWRLPIQELRWGRFLSDGPSLVWIEWRGPRPLSLALLDGKEAVVERVDDDRVVLGEPEAILSLTLRATLREGRLGAAVLDGIPGLRGTLPARMLAVHESRRYSSGVLEVGTARHEGEALHEVVRWP